jgi:hypothetical protein
MLSLLGPFRKHLNHPTEDFVSQPPLSFRCPGTLYYYQKYIFSHSPLQIAEIFSVWGVWLCGSVVEQLINLTLFKVAMRLIVLYYFTLSITLDDFTRQEESAATQ